MEIEQIATSNLLPYVNNARTHSESQIAQIAASIKEFGFNNPVLIDAQGTIIAGHGRVEAARVLGLTSVPCIRLEHLTEHQKKAYIIADNQLALNAGWDNEFLRLELEELKDVGFDIDLLGFDAKSIDDILKDEQQDEENEYTQKVSSPTYEPSGEKPDIRELFDDEKAFALIEKIKASKLPQAEKDFLMLAAGRHVRLDFELIADYYAHSEKEMQELMEDNALVIVDFQKAIENGWVRLSQELNEIYDTDNTDDEE